MKISRAELTTRAQVRDATRVRAAEASRFRELVWLVAGSIVIVAGLYLVYSAKTRNLAEVEAGTLNLNRLTGPQQLIPYLGMVPSQADQDYIANRIADRKRHGEVFTNTGAVARLRVTQSDMAGVRARVTYVQRIAEARELRDAKEKEAEAQRGWLARHLPGLRSRRREREISIPLLTGAEFSLLKPSLRVRNVADFRRPFLLSTGLFFAAFYLVHLAWRFRSFSGDNFMLPILHVLSGIGLVLMISLRDPLRDALLFTDFAIGVAAGCIALFLFSIPNYERQLGRLAYVPLAAALLLALALGFLGTGPGTSEAKVNLFFFQPVEVIRILLVLFLAGYFAQNWDSLRQLRQKNGRLANLSARFNVPRLDYALPVIAGVAVSLCLFFWLSDLGPALVIACLFLTMYSIARGRVLLAACGLAALVSGFAIGYVGGYPHTVRERVEMWLSPWDNHVLGGDQLADSLWALATGGSTGTGLGLGDPQTVPAAHTDLIISAFGEQLGLMGIAALFTLYGLLIYRSLRIARNASGTYSFFLVLGLTCIIAFQTLLITGGLLGLVPLSGVVSPFLSYGKTAMVANFALFAMILSVSSRGGKQVANTTFNSGLRVLTMVFGACLLLVFARFAWIQALRADSVLVRGSLVLQADGVRRYQYNPRLLEIARSLPKGTIYDRNGLPLATSDWPQIEAHRPDYQKLGVALDQTTSQSSAAANRRQYPLGPLMFYMLGDVRTRLKQGATNTAFQERSSRIRLQGYDDVTEYEQSRDSDTGQITTRVTRDYRALLPLLHHRYEPDNPEVKQILTRPRDIHMSIDAALQVRASEILKRHLTALGKQKGAVVIMDPANGDLLAAVSYPWPTQLQLTGLTASASAPLPDADLIDRARFGLYPPGSSFKIVTAIAALRKDPSLVKQRYDCIPLPDGRAGNYVWKREIRDDVQDRVPHGSVDMQRGITVSCNAFFAQLGANSVGSEILFDTATRLGISVARPNTAPRLQQYLPQASYGQGEVVVSPFQMARVAATIANGGDTPEGRWIIDETNLRVHPPEPLLPAALASQIGGFMRTVVTSGTGRVLNSSPIPIAGKTGTAELAKAPSHAWFIGYAPYGGREKSAKQISFAVLVENGQYGGTAAAPIAGEIVAAARQLGLL